MFSYFSARLSTSLWERDNESRTDAWKTWTHCYLHPANVPSSDITSDQKLGSFNESFFFPVIESSMLYISRWQLSLASLWKMDLVDILFKIIFYKRYLSHTHTCLYAIDFLSNIVFCVYLFARLNLSAAIYFYKKNKWTVRLTDIRKNNLFFVLVACEQREKSENPLGD